MRPNSSGVVLLRGGGLGTPGVLAHAEGECGGLLTLDLSPAGGCEPPVASNQALVVRISLASRDMVLWRHVEPQGGRLVTRLPVDPDECVWVACSGGAGFAVYGHVDPPHIAA